MEMREGIYLWGYWRRSSGVCLCPGFGPRWQSWRARPHF